jgi:hypothetical protein
MQVAGSRSWRSTFDVPEAPHIALFIRDALGLDGAEDAPPRLEGEIPDRASLIDDRDHVASLWRSWWCTLAPAGPLDAGAAALSDGELSEVVRDLQPEAQAWFYGHREPHIQPQRGGMRDWEITRDAVESAAIELRVAPHALHADTWLLLVEGDWWDRPGPGQLIYSPTIREDSELFLRLLRSAFRSSL